MNALVYVDIDQGIHKGKMKVALNEKQKKLRGLSFSINIANFEAFLLVFKLTKNFLFLKSELQAQFFQKKTRRLPNNCTFLHFSPLYHIQVRSIVMYAELRSNVQVVCVIEVYKCL